MLAASRCVVNAQDIEIVNLKKRCQELEERRSTLEEERTNLEAELVNLKRQSIKTAFTKKK